jgi:hypothetical protein
MKSLIESYNCKEFKVCLFLHHKEKKYEVIAVDMTSGSNEHIGGEAYFGRGKFSRKEAKSFVKSSVEGIIHLIHSAVD